jgi:probable phosphoglycerate mutase
VIFRGEYVLLARNSAGIGYHFPPMKNTNSPFRICLVRHGETEWNRDGRWQGHADVPLNAAGREQAARLARRMADAGMRFNRLYSSDLRRAWETAEPIGAALGLKPAAARALREIDLGAWSGKTREEIARDDPETWARLQANEDIPRGGGETYAALGRRVLDWLEATIREDAGRSVCAVTHGGCIRAILLHALGLQWIDRGRLPIIRNASISVLELTDGSWSVPVPSETLEGMGREGDPARGAEEA